MSSKKSTISGDHRMPYERFADFGAEKLTDSELLAIILRKGTKDRSALDIASDLLELYGGRDGILGLMLFSEADFRSIKGIGPVKAVQLCAISELSKRIWKAKAAEGLRLDTPSSIAAYYKEELRYCNQEKVMLLLLDSRHRFLQSVPISLGTVDSSAISPREIFFEALRFRAAAFVVVHNHPSGSTRPSRTDIEFASMLQIMGSIMNIPLLDCLIIGNNEYLSFSEQGLLKSASEA